jgi:hypothetical protein
LHGVEYIWEKKYTADKFEAKVFPNPVPKNQHLKILLTETFNLPNTSISIFGTNGELIMKINNPSFMNEIHINNRFSTGLYHVVVVNPKDKMRIVKEFIVN